MSFCIQCGSKLTDDAAFCGKCGQKAGAPLNSQPVNYENDLIERARAAQAQRDRQAMDARNSAALLEEQRKNMLVYMQESAKRVADLAKKAGLPVMDRCVFKGWAGHCHNDFYVGAYGQLLHGYGYSQGNATRIKKYKDCTTDCKRLLDRFINFVANGNSNPILAPHTLPEAEIRQRVDKVFEAALVGNPQ